MSGRIVGEVLVNAPEDLTPLELLVLVCLAESAREADRTARFKADSEHLAYRARSTPSSIRNVLARLKERGLITPVHARPTRGQAQEWVLAKMTDATRRAVWKASPRRDANGTPQRHRGVTQTARSPDPNSVTTE